MLFCFGLVLFVCLVYMNSRVSPPHCCEERHEGVVCFCFVSFNIKPRVVQPGLIVIFGGFLFICYLF